MLRYPCFVVGVASSRSRLAMLAREGELDIERLLPEAEFGKEFPEMLLIRERLELVGTLSDPAGSSERAG